MAFSRRRFAELCNSRHPFFKLPTEIRQTIYSMSQLHVPKDEASIMTFGTNKPLSEAFKQQVSLVHVCRLFRQELLPIVFAERQLCFLYDGVLTSSVPPGIELLPTDVLNTAQSILLEFDIILPPYVHELASQLTTCVQVRLEGEHYDVGVHLNNNWEKCNTNKLLGFLGSMLDELNDKIQRALGARQVSEGNVAVHVLSQGKSITVNLQNVPVELQAEATPVVGQRLPAIKFASSEYESQYDSDSSDEEMPLLGCETSTSSTGSPAPVEGSIKPCIRTKLRKAFHDAKEDVRDMRRALKGYIRLE